jgi:hypothetical protein
MKVSKPLTVAPPSHKDDGSVWPHRDFDHHLRREIKGLASRGIPVTMKGDILCYRNKVEGVRFDSLIDGLGEINQWSLGWILNAFLLQVGVERLIKVLPDLEVENLRQSDDGALMWQWNKRSFVAFWLGESTLYLSISDGESRRDDVSDLIGPLTSDFILQSMYRIERAFSVQLKLKLHLEGKEGLSVKVIPNHVVADNCVVKVPLEGPLYYKEAGRVYDAATTRIHGFIEEFEERVRMATATATVAPAAAMSTNLDLY